MAELDRTITEELFTEVLESTPCIIVYSQQAFEYSKNYIKSITQTAKEIFDSILGIHECKIVYKGKDKKIFDRINSLLKN
ncbi:MAG: hypothetical protein ACLSIB_13745 [Parabacteroides merdae]